MSDQPTLEIRAERARLGEAWLDAHRCALELKTDDSHAADQRAWDALVEFVAENGLTGTVLDPRNQLDAWGQW